MDWELNDKKDQPWKKKKIKGRAFEHFIKKEDNNEDAEEEEEKRRIKE